MPGCPLLSGSGFISKALGSPSFSLSPSSSKTSRSRMMRILHPLVKKINQLAVDSLFSLDEASVIRLQPDEASLPQFAVMNVVICLGGQHGLHKVLDVAEDDSEPFAGRSGACQWLDLDALHDGSQGLPRRTIEYCFE